MNIIKLLVLNSDGLAFVVAIITIVSTYYLSRHTGSHEIIKKQHEKLISPIFFLIEPYLFKEMNNDILNKAFELIEQNKSLVDGRLLEVVYFYKENPSQINYNAFCSYINKTYDKTCKQLRIKTRSIEYRISRRQYKTKLSLFIYICFIIAKSLLVLGVILLTFLSLLVLGYYFFSKTKFSENIPILLLIIFPMIFVLLKYLDN